MPDTGSPRYIFEDGDYALIVDRKGRRYLERLRPSATFHSHLGTFLHDQVLGQTEGTWITTSSAHTLLAVKPTMADFTRQMPRIATVVYPKDLGAIIIFGDIFPGARVLEAGAGSGAVTIALARAVGERGRVVSYDIRPDMVERAGANVAAMLSDVSSVEIKVGDVYEAFEERELDRVVLDLPEPWRVVPNASSALVPGGVFLSFLPTVMQFHELTAALKADGTFEMIETVEMMLRPWSVAPRSVRPVSPNPPKEGVGLAS